MRYTIKVTDQEAYDKRPRADREDIQPWLDALRSGKYTRGKTRLVTYTGIGEAGKKSYTFCCLGVLCEVTGCTMVDDYAYFFKDPKHQMVYTLQSFHPLYGLLGIYGEFKGCVVQYNDGIYGDLAALNDSGYFDFPEIADIIEEVFL